MMQTLPVELTRLPILEKLYLDNNKLSVLPPELGELKTLKTLPVELTLLLILENLYLDNNKLSVLPPEPVELRQTVWLVELDVVELDIVFFTPTPLSLIA
ncbi:hypothetical protein CCACVL1_13662 [Corchorus capsularis]|uniref:Uncharacterized protein n=1 Tax=Corchorus capsularis TaxID=210143 RepID=A0A1R3IA92_COCAP|nr:hypothetical protein CCACVL1_13662 [Corchorus capsularis]